VTTETPTFLDLVRKDLRFEANDSEIQQLEADPDNWRSILVHEIKNLDDVIMDLRQQCWPLGKEGKKKFQIERAPLAVRKTMIQKKLPEINLLIKERNIKRSQERAKELGIKATERIDYGVELMEIKKMLKEIKSLLTKKRKKAKK